MKIVICTDRSSNGLAAVSMGGRLASVLGSNIQVTLLVAGKTESKSQNALNKAKKIFLDFGVQADSHIYVGTSVDGFVCEIQEGQYDLAIIGYRKRSALEKLFMGCVAAQVAHQVPTNIMVVRDGRPDLCRILIGIGGDGFTYQVSQWGGKIAAAMGARATLIHVETAPPLMYAGLAEVHQTLNELLETHTPAAIALRQAAKILEDAGVQADIKLAHGVADREILRTAQEGDYDLIVLGSSWARSPINRVILPNVTRNILLNTRRPVLVVHP